MKNKTLQFKFMLSILIVVIIPLLVTPILGYIYTSHILRDKLVALNNQNLEAVSEGVNQVIDNVIIASNVIVLDSRIGQILQNPSQNTSGRLAQGRFVESVLKNVEASNLYPYNVETVLIDLKGKAYRTSIEEHRGEVDYLNEKWFRDAIENKGYFIWIGTEMKNMNYQGGITMVRLVKENYHTPIGVLLIHIYPEKKVKNLLIREEEVEGTSRYLIDASNDIILRSRMDIDDDLVPSMLLTLEGKNSIITDIKGEKMLVSSQSIKKTNWSILQMVPYKSIMVDVGNYRDLIIITNILSAVVMMLIAFLVTKKVTKAISGLSFFMEKVTAGNFNVKSNISGSYEVNQLSSSFNKMVDRIEELVTQVAYETEQRQQTKLEALQAQINPHFLLNTLNGIKWLCVIESAKTAEKMLISLGFLLENSLGRYDELITIEEEMKCLENYCELQKMRYGKKFELHHEVEETLRQIKVPVLLLQPIVENSILHAFEDMEEMGMISISIQEVSEYVKIVIKDNGIGIDQGNINQLLSVYPQKNKYSSMGMRNVRDRIKLYYGQQCDMVIESDVGMGTQTTLTILKEIKKRSDDDEGINR